MSPLRIRSSSAADLAETGVFRARRLQGVVGKEFPGEVGVGGVVPQVVLFARVPLEIEESEFPRLRGGYQAGIKSLCRSGFLGFFVDLSMRRPLHTVFAASG